MTYSIACVSPSLTKTQPDIPHCLLFDSLRLVLLHCFTVPDQVLDSKGEQIQLILCHPTAQHPLGSFLDPCTMLPINVYSLIETI